jgi:hypothetical protein
VATVKLWLSYLRYWRWTGQWPSRLQRLYMQGDPTGEVRAISDAVLAEIRAEDENNEGGNPP